MCQIVTSITYRSLENTKAFVQSEMRNMNSRLIPSFLIPAAFLFPPNFSLILRLLFLLLTSSFPSHFPVRGVLTSFEGFLVSRISVMLREKALLLVIWCCIVLNYTKQNKPTFIYNTSTIHSFPANHLSQGASHSVMCLPVRRCSAVSASAWCLPPCGVLLHRIRTFEEFTGHELPATIPINGQ